MSDINVVQSLPHVGEEVVYIKIIEGLHKDDPLIPLIKERAEFGRNKYGQDLMTFDGRDTDLEIRQELIDAIFYAKKGLMESGDLSYVHVLASVQSLLRFMLDKQGGQA
jgi:hypothetical protein